MVVGVVATGRRTTVEGVATAGWSEARWLARLASVTAWVLAVGTVVVGAVVAGATVVALDPFVGARWVAWGDPTAAAVWSRTPWGIVVEVSPTAKRTTRAEATNTALPTLRRDAESSSTASSLQAQEPVTATSYEGRNTIATSVTRTR